MEKSQLQGILADPASTNEERSIAQARLDALEADDLSSLEAQLLQRTGEPYLRAVDYYDLHRLCSERRWDYSARRLYESWLGVLLWDD